MKKAKTGGLGRGLGALGLGKNALAGAPKPAEQPVPPETVEPAAQTGKPAELPVDAIVPNRFQPRREFDEAALEELRESIVRHGILQPLSVRDIGGGKYELIAGERRRHASRDSRPFPSSFARHPTRSWRRWHSSRTSSARI